MDGGVERVTGILHTEYLRTWDEYVYIIIIIIVKMLIT